ncbi:MAG: YicC family protein [Clostridia bacterium]|nr:YicC family protein [Clostridia bacterium]
MIKSMTGFGRGEYTDEKRNIVVEIKSVNHRYSDINVKLPRKYAFAEDKIKNLIKETAKRGKIDVFVNFENLSENDVHISLNKGLAQEYYDNLIELKECFDLKEDVSLGRLAQMPEVLKAMPDVDNEDEICEAILKATKVAAEKHDEMRKVEGAKLGEDLLAKGELIKSILDEIEEFAPQVPLLYKEKLMERINSYLNGEIEIPEDRIMAEVAVFADKCAIDEEITRLNSHLVQLKDIILGGSGGEGKKLDFLVQEMNREANTIGSKANNLDITNNMLKIKYEIEKIREQVQNIE